MALSDLPWDILYLIFTTHPGNYNIGVRLNREFHQELTTLVLPRISQWKVLPREIQRYVINLWHHPPIKIYFIHPRHCEFEEFLGGRDQLPGAPFPMRERYQWTVSIQNSRYSETYTGYPQLIERIDKLVTSGYHLDPCSYHTIMSRRFSCIHMDPDYAETRSYDYLNTLLQSHTMPLYRQLLIEMCNRSIRHHGGKERYLELSTLLERFRDRDVT
jgi:hypothetical protein